MPINTILLPEFNFVYTFFQGRVEDLQIRAWTDRMNKDLEEFSSCREIIDLSGDIDFSGLSSEALTQAGSRERERPTAGSGPLAILVSTPLSFGLARAYSTLIGEARTQVRIFYSLDECIALMGLSECQSARLKTQLRMKGLDASASKGAGPVDFRFPSD